MRHLATAALVTIATAPALAQDTITIEAEDGFRLVRCVDVAGHASCQYISNSTTMMSCVAIDADGEPLAVASAFSGSGAVIFSDIPVDTIANVICS